MNYWRRVIGSFLLAITAFFFGNISSTLWSVEQYILSFNVPIPPAFTDSQYVPPDLKKYVPQEQAADGPLLQQNSKKLGESFTLDNVQYVIKTAKKIPCHVKCSGTTKNILVTFTAENMGDKATPIASLAILDSADSQYLGRGWYATNAGLLTSLKPGLLENLEDEFSISSKSTGIMLVLTHQSGRIGYLVPLGI